MVVELQAASIGFIADEMIKSTNFRGTVTNIFSNSFYLKAMNGGIIFFTNSPTRSPITVNLVTKCSNLHPLQQLVGRAGCIDGGDVLIHTKDAEIFHQQIITPIQLSQLPQFTRILEIGAFILAAIDTTNSVLDEHAITHERISDFIRSMLPHLHTDSMHDEFYERAPTLIGLGSGFTPSGDDFLGGFLATYNTFAASLRRPLLKLNSLETKTNWTSAKLLDCMQLRILDEEMSQLIRSVACADQDQFTISLESLASRGHTSGIDIATGAMIALSIICDARYGTDLTPRIAEQLGRYG